MSARRLFIAAGTIKGNEQVITSFDGAEFRRVLGHYPTGVCAITAVEDGAPLGMVVGSFTSVSLDPPLVAFFPDRSSSTWPRIAQTGRFCVNVLSARQLDVCRALAARSAGSKFDSVPHSASPQGLPVIDGCIAWIDCTLDAVHEAGDHFIVVGKVDALEAQHPELPLLFFQGGYGQFSPMM